MQWHDEAAKAYFEQKLTVEEVAKAVKKSPRTVARHLSTLPGYGAEKQQRKTSSKEKRVKYQRRWQASKRRTTGYVEATQLKRQHDIDVRVLSSEKY